MLCYCIHITKCCKVSFSMLQSQFIFYKGSEKTLLSQWEIKFDTHIFAFPSGCVKGVPGECVVGTLKTVCTLYASTQMCLNVENGIPVGFCVMQIVNTIYLNSSKTFPVSLLSLAGQIAGRLAALQSPGLLSLHPSAPTALSPPTAGF